MRRLKKVGRNLYMQPQAIPEMVLVLSSTQERVKDLEGLLTRASEALDLAGGNVELVAEINAALLLGN
jgi:hypothetical protein